MIIDQQTTLYGVVGYPIGHSLSPTMHNAAFSAKGLNAVYLAFETSDLEGCLKGMKALGINGMSVTIPHKETVIPHLDSIDPVAKKIGAVNTLVIKDTAIHGLNTDWLGANRALEEKMELAGSSILLLGAGGSAKAIGFGLIEAGAQVTIASRTPEKGQALAQTLGCPWIPLEQASHTQANALVNATSVGMEPNERQTDPPTTERAAPRVARSGDRATTEGLLKLPAADGSAEVAGKAAKTLLLRATLE